MLVVCDEDNNQINDGDIIDIGSWDFSTTNISFMYQEHFRVPRDIHNVYGGWDISYQNGDNKMSIIYRNDIYLSIIYSPVVDTINYRNILKNPEGDVLQISAHQNVISTDGLHETSYAILGDTDGSGTFIGFYRVLFKQNGLLKSYTGNSSSTYYNNPIRNTGRGLMISLASYLTFGGEPTVNDYGTLKFSYKALFDSVSGYIVPKQIIKNDSTGNSHMVSLISIVEDSIVSAKNYLNGVDIRVARQWSSIGLYIPKYGIDTIGYLNSREAIEVTLNAATTEDVVKTKNTYSPIENQINGTDVLFGFYSANKKSLPISQRCQHYIIFPKNIIEGFYFKNKEEKSRAKYLYVKAIYGTEASGQFVDVKLSSIQGIGATKVINSPNDNTLNLLHEPFAMYFLKPGTSNNKIVGFQIMVTEHEIRTPSFSANPGNWDRFNHMDLYAGKGYSVDTKKCFVFYNLLKKEAYNSVKNNSFNAYNVTFCNHQNDFATGFNGNTELDGNNLPLFDNESYAFTLNNIHEMMIQRAWVIKTFKLVSDNWTLGKKLEYPKDTRKSLN